jgi:hypothetical protein
MESIRYAFRRPRFPVIWAIDGYLIGAQSPASLQRRLTALEFSAEKELRLVDGNGENWMFLPDQMILAPGFLTRKWRKIEIIRLFNESRNAKESGIRYPEHCDSKQTPRRDRSRYCGANICWEKGTGWFWRFAEER